MLNKKEIRGLLRAAERNQEEMGAVVNLYGKLLFMSKEHARELLELNRKHRKYFGETVTNCTERGMIEYKKLEAEIEVLENVLGN